MSYSYQKVSNPLFAFLAGMAAWALFGPKIKQKLAEHDELQDTYDRIVDEATDKYAKAKGISQHELKDLADDLKTHWQKIKRAWQRG